MLRCTFASFLRGIGGRRTEQASSDSLLSPRAVTAPPGGTAFFDILYKPARGDSCADRGLRWFPVALGATLASEAIGTNRSQSESIGLIPIGSDKFGFLRIIGAAVGQSCPISKSAASDRSPAVSYTHLTLPTILLV